MALYYGGIFFKIMAFNDLLLIILFLFIVFVYIYIVVVSVVGRMCMHSEYKARIKAAVDIIKIHMEKGKILNIREVFDILDNK